jgi:hypothetical protein
MSEGDMLHHITRDLSSNGMLPCEGRSCSLQLVYVHEANLTDFEVL